MNNSLSDLLQVMDLSPNSSSSSSKGKYTNNDAASIGTKDSLRRNNAEKLTKRGTKKCILSVPGEGSFSDHSMTDMFGSSYSFHDSNSMDLETTATPPVAIDPTTAKVKEGSTPKRSKRGGRKLDEKSDLERSLSGLGLDDPNDAKNTITGRRVPKDCQTVSTMDSIEREKSSTKTSKRGGKKSTVSGGKSDLERSLSGLDFEDDNVCNLKNAAANNNDCHTISTMDSMDKEKSFSKPSKRGGKKSSVPGKFDLERSLSELDCGDDDALLFHTTATILENDSRTVSTMDSLQRDKITKKPSKRGSKKNDVVVSTITTISKPQPYEKLKPSSTSLSSSLSKLGGPPRDFGRHADDNDTFCDVGGCDNPVTATATSKSKQMSVLQPHNVPLSTLSSSFMKSSPFSNTSNNNDDDSDDSDDEVLFTSFSGKNPFRLATHL